jgi:hypothetical protein
LKGQANRTLDLFVLIHFSHTYYSTFQRQVFRVFGLLGGVTSMKAW